MKTLLSPFVLFFILSALVNGSGLSARASEETFIDRMIEQVKSVPQHWSRCVESVHEKFYYIQGDLSSLKPVDQGLLSFLDDNRLLLRENQLILRTIGNMDQFREYPKAGVHQIYQFVMNQNKFIKQHQWIASRLKSAILLESELKINASQRVSEYYELKNSEIDAKLMDMVLGFVNSDSRIDSTLDTMLNAYERSRWLIRSGSHFGFRRDRLEDLRDHLVTIVWFIKTLKQSQDISPQKYGLLKQQILTRLDLRAHDYAHELPLLTDQDKIPFQWIESVLGNGKIP
jgi:hypothetical protein